MKYFAIVLALALFALAQAVELSPEQVEIIKIRHNECKPQTNVDDDAVKNAIKNNVWSDDPKLKAHFLCMSKKGGLQNEEGVLQLDVIKAKMGKTLTAEQVNAIVTKCAIQKATPEDTATDLWKCWRSQKV